MIRRGLVLMGFAAACVLSACVPGADAPGTSPAPTAATSSTPAPGVTPVTPALTATGPDGAEVSVPAAPQRIVCLTGICDDILASLGIVPVATSTPNLVTRPEIFGDKGKDIPVVPGSFGAEDTSFAAEVKPDLVIGLAGVHEALKPALEKFSPVLLVNVKTDEDSLAYLRMVATLTGKADAQVKAETAYQEAMAAAKQKAATAGVAGEPVLLMWGGASGMGVATKGADPLGSALGKVVNNPFEVLGTDPVKAGAYSMEQILEKDPKVMFVSSMTFAPTDKKATEIYADNPVWKQLTAVKNGHVHEVNKELWTFCRGTRCIATAVTEAVDHIERDLKK